MLGVKSAEGRGAPGRAAVPYPDAAVCARFFRLRQTCRVNVTVRPSPPSPPPCLHSDSGPAFPARTLCSINVASWHLSDEALPMRFLT